MTDLKTWPVLETKTDIENRIFSIKTKTCRSPRTGRALDFYIMEVGPWVNIIPLTPDRRVVMVRQFRHGTREVTLEIPGGLVDAGQTPVDAAVRELREETGFTCDQATLLGKVRPNPAFMNNWCYSYLATDVALTQNRQMDPGEDLETVLVDLDQIPEMIRDGRIDHSLVISAFYHFYNTK